MASEERSSNQIPEELDLRDPRAIASPTFMDDLRATMREKAHRNLAEHEQNIQRFNRMVELIHPKRESDEDPVPESFIEELAHTKLLNDEEIHSILDGRNYSLRPSVKPYTDEERKRFSFMHFKRVQNPDYEEHPGEYYVQARKLKDPELLYRLHLVEQMRRGRWYVSGDSVTTRYTDTNALEWIAQHRKEIEAFHTGKTIVFGSYYNFVSSNDSETTRQKILSAGEKLRLLHQEVPDLKKIILIDGAGPNLEGGLDSGEVYLDAILQSSPEQIRGTLRVLEKIQTATSAYMAHYAIDEFFFLNQFLHQHPALLEKTDWSQKPVYISQYHPSAFILRATLPGEAEFKNWINGYIEQTELPIKDWSEELLDGQQLGQFHSLREDNFFTTMNRFIHRLQPLEADELRELIKHHFEIDLSELGDLLSQHEFWESPESIKKLRILALHRLAHGERLKGVDVDLAQTNEIDAGLIAWCCGLRDLDDVQFDALAWIDRYGTAYFSSKLARLDRWRKDPNSFTKARRAGLFSPELDNRAEEYSSFLCHYQTLSEYEGGLVQLAEEIMKIRRVIPHFKYEASKHVPPEPYMQVAANERIADPELVEQTIAPYTEKILSKYKSNPEKCIFLLKRVLGMSFFNRNCIHEVCEIMKARAGEWSAENSSLAQDLFSVFVDAHLKFSDAETLGATLFELPLDPETQKRIYTYLIRSKLSTKPDVARAVFAPYIRTLGEKLEDEKEAMHLTDILLMMVSAKIVAENFFKMTEFIMASYGEKWEKDNPAMSDKLKSLYIELSIQNCTRAQGWEELFDSLRSLKVDLKEHQILFARILESALAQGEFNAINEIAPEIKPAPGDYMKSFISKYNLGAKGKTIVVLTATNEYRDAESMTQLIGNTIEALERYEVILDEYAQRDVPKEIYASIGMEYEITGSTAEGYTERTHGRNLAIDIRRLSGYSGTGSGRDAIHEIATQPTDNPAALILEMHLYQELGFIDFNFNGPNYEKGAHGYHVTIGGAHGVRIDWSTNLLQNALIMSNWGGVNSGKEIDQLSRGRGVNIRQRRGGDSNNVALFGTPTDSVELRCLSIDKEEPFERAILASHDGAIAIQAIEKYTRITPGHLEAWKNDFPEDQFSFNHKIRNENLLKEEPSDPRILEIIHAWCRMSWKILKAVEIHNEHFISNETQGYFDTHDHWVEVEEYGGEYNARRFESVAEDVGKSLTDYLADTKIDGSALFNPVQTPLVNAMTRVNNLYLKPSIERGGDMVNASAMLSVTKLDNQTLEEAHGNVVEKSMFERGGQRREGYYALQGGSEVMIVHQTQIALLEFQRSMKRILHQEIRAAA